MEIPQVISLLSESSFAPPIRFFKYIMDDKTKPCASCLRYAGEIFPENDPRLPSLPIHPNCDCFFEEVTKEEYLKQKNFKFGNMDHDTWYNQTEDEKYQWCNSFRNRFGNAIDKYAEQYNIPKQLLAGIIANEMLDWRFPDGTMIDGAGGGGIGYAQISTKTARAHGTDGSVFKIRKTLESYEGSVAVAAKILKDYWEEFQNSIKNDRLGQGFRKSTLYYMANPCMLQRDDFVSMNVPEWVLNSMCAVWNSGIDIIYAKDPIGDKNYRNAYINGINSTYLLKHLPKSVNE